MLPHEINGYGSVLRLKLTSTYYFNSFQVCVNDAEGCVCLFVTGDTVSDQGS